MADGDIGSGFKRAKIRDYSVDELQGFAEDLNERIQRLRQVSASYNDQVRDALNERGRSSEQQLAYANHYSLRRDVASEMADAAAKDTASIDIELQLRWS